MATKLRPRPPAMRLAPLPCSLPRPSNTPEAASTCPPAGVNTIALDVGTSHARNSVPTTPPPLHTATHLPTLCPPSPPIPLHPFPCSLDRLPARGAGHHRTRDGCLPSRRRRHLPDGLPLHLSLSGLCADARRQLQAESSSPVRASQHNRGGRASGRCVPSLPEGRAAIVGGQCWAGQRALRLRRQVGQCTSGISGVV